MSRSVVRDRAVLLVLVFSTLLAACGDDGGGGGTGGGGGGSGGGAGGGGGSGGGAGGGPDGGVDPDGVAVTITGPSVTSGLDEELSFACPALVDCDFECALDGAAFAPCTSPATVDLPDEGDHLFHVRASATDGRTGEADHAITVDRTEPSLEAVELTEYDLVVLTFDEPLAAPVLGEFSITSQPSGMAVHAVAVDGSQLLVRLSRLHLPWNGYRLSFTARDLAGNDLVVADLDLTPELHSRLAFVTESTFLGAIPLPGGVACGDASTGLRRADCVCQAEASAAGMVGTFRAALSATGQDAYCRMRGLDGTEADNCGLAPGATLPALGPWVRPDGLPVSGDYTDGNGIFYAHPGMQLDGDIPASGVWTGSTNALNASGSNCTDWSVSETVAGTHGHPSNTRLPFMWSALGSTCNNPFALLCVQVDDGGLPTQPIVDVPATARRVFISSTETDGSIEHPSGATGLAAADAHCTDLAAAAGLPGDSYVALLSDADEDAFCRLLGLPGERGANDCGATVEQLMDGPYVSVHGHVLAEHVAELLGTGVREPYMANEAGEFGFMQITWTGTTNLLQGTGTDCSGWTSTSGSGNLGAPYDGDEFINAGGNVCTTTAHLICVER